jgi:hypothetical protein
MLAQLKKKKIMKGGNETTAQLKIIKKKSVGSDRNAISVRRRK